MQFMTYELRAQKSVALLGYGRLISESVLPK